MKATIEGDELVIRLNLQEPTASASGKTLVVASSRGNVTTDAEVAGQKVVIGVNAYIYPPKK